MAGEDDEFVAKTSIRCYFLAILKNRAHFSDLLRRIQTEIRIHKVEHRRLRSDVWVSYYLKERERNDGIFGEGHFVMFSKRIQELDYFVIIHIQRERLAHVFSLLPIR